MRCSAELSNRMDFIRLVAIISIVWGHCLYDWENRSFGSGSLDYAELVLLESGRLGTICFFLLSGYFLSDKIHNWTITDYLQARFRPIILPWFLYLSLFVVIATLRTSYDLNTSHPVSFLRKAVSFYKIFIFHAAYWFVPAALICGSLLILLRRWLNNRWLGIILLLITLFYAVNLYVRWLDVNHTKAVLGYTLFTWLGLQFRRNEEKVLTYISHVSWPAMLLAVSVFFIAGCFESALLKLLHSPDPFASIRLSNILLSLTLFCVCFKMQWFSRLQLHRPRRYVYGLYLVHSIVISQLIRLPFFAAAQRSHFIFVVLMSHIALFVLTMLLSMALLFMIRVLRLNATPLRKQTVNRAPAISASTDS